MSKYTLLGIRALAAMLLCLLTGAVLLWAIPQAEYLPYRLQYDLMRQGVLLPQGTFRMVQVEVWLTVGPLVAVNLCWVAYALCRWCRKLVAQLPPLPNDTSTLFQAPAAPSQKGPSPHVQPAANTLKDSP
jgi:hypothetical protein